MMKRNLDSEYINKLVNMKAPNGYKFDVINYTQNPYCSDYPSFTKIIAEDELTLTIKRVYYIRAYNGEDEYVEGIYVTEVLKVAKDGFFDSRMVIESNREFVGTGGRFSLKKLLSFCT